MISAPFVAHSYTHAFQRLAAFLDFSYIYSPAFVKRGIIFKHLEDITHCLVLL